MEDSRLGRRRKHELETFTSVFSAQDSAVNVVDFPAFFCEFPADGRHEIKFFISIRGKEYPTNLLAEPTAVFSRKIRMYVRNGVMFTLSGRTLVIRNVDEDEKYRAEREQSKNFKGNVKSCATLLLNTAERTKSSSTTICTRSTSITAIISSRMI